jgi:hypothetical protein
MPFFILSALIIGAAGFLAGFLGPIFLEPNANQGPLLGIFITGPLSAVAGAILGVVLPRLVPDRHRLWVLVTLAALTGLGILTGLVCLRAPEFVGRLYHAEVADKGPAVELIPSAIRKWEDMASQYPHAPKTGWQDDRRTMVHTAGGRAVTLKSASVWLVYRERRPWNHGRRRLVPQPMEPELDAYLAPADPLNSPGWFISRHDRVSPDWPPRRVGDFLGLIEISVAPAELRPPMD